MTFFQKVLILKSDRQFHQFERFRIEKKESRFVKYDIFVAYFVMIV